MPSEGHNRSKGDNTLSSMLAQGGPPWSQRKDKAFFRGSMYCHSGFPHRIQGVRAVATS